MNRSIPSTCSFALLAACAGGPVPTDDTADTEPPVFPVWDCPDHPCDTLSQYGFFDDPVSDRVPAPGVLEWEPVAKLWSDHAAKERLLAIPDGEAVGFVGPPDASGEEVWDFPVGTAVIKTFLFLDDFGEPTSQQTVIETRLLVRRSDGDWDANVFLWRDDQTGADLYNYGTRVPVTFVDEADQEFSIEYVVPNSSMCERCHGRSDSNHLLGVFTAQGNHEVDRGGPVNQIAWLESLGVFDGEVPDPATLPALADPFGDADLDLRARSYLHANCSHCHRSGGGADGSGLVLLAWETDPSAIGVCKRPPAAGPGTCGLDYDIVPGDPDNSIVVCRMSSTEPEIRMPELPNVLTDPAGIALVSDWISGMSGACAE